MPADGGQAGRVRHLLRGHDRDPPALSFDQFAQVVEQVVDVGVIQPAPVDGTKEASSRLTLPRLRASSRLTMRLRTV